MSTEKVYQWENAYKNMPPDDWQGIVRLDGRVYDNEDTAFIRLFVMHTFSKVEWLKEVAS